MQQAGKLDNSIDLERRVAVVDLRDAQRAGVQADALAERRPSGEVVAFRRAADYGLLGLTNIWKVTPLDEAWIAAYRFVAQAGVLVVGEVRIYPRETPPPLGPWAHGEWSGTITGCAAMVPAGGLTTTIARLGANIGSRLVDAQRDIAWAPAEAKLARQHGLTRTHDPFSDQGIWGEVGIAEPEQLTVSPGRRAAALVRQARAARAYVEALELGNRATVEAVAARLRVDYSKALTLIHAARKNDLLLPKVAKQGRPEGRLTPRAKQLLQVAAPRVKKTRATKKRRQAPAERKSR